jgi:hypothetical protein
MSYRTASRIDIRPPPAYATDRQPDTAEMGRTVGTAAPPSRFVPATAAPSARLAGQLAAAWFSATSSRSPSNSRPNRNPIASNPDVVARPAKGRGRLPVGVRRRLADPVGNGSRQLSKAACRALAGLAGVAHAVRHAGTRRVGTMESEWRTPFGTPRGIAGRTARIELGPTVDLEHVLVADRSRRSDCMHHRSRRGARTRAPNVIDEVARGRRTRRGGRPRLR